VSCEEKVSDARWLPLPGVAADGRPGQHGPCVRQSPMHEKVINVVNQAALKRIPTRNQSCPQ